MIKHDISVHTRYLDLKLRSLRGTGNEHRSAFQRVQCIAEEKDHGTRHDIPNSTKSSVYPSIIENCNFSLEPLDGAERVDLMAIH